ncbi:MAG: flagellar basal body-associated FliL family protein [Eubacterium sp.]|jgi:flagellar basal body-associated protein FliL|nr:flagellar basal body-associated FliL family protein [Eubacterium sp.]
MKKNLITVVILALVLVNLILTAILTITILPQTKKANELITQVCSAINLELRSGSVTSDSMSVPIDKVASHDIPEMTINLKDSGDGKSHYATVSVSLSMNTESDGYKEYGETMAERDSLIKSQINAVVSGYTYEEFTANQQEVQNAILADLQKLFSSDFIVSVGFPTVTSQ